MHLPLVGARDSLHGIHKLLGLAHRVLASTAQGVLSPAGDSRDRDAPATGWDGRWLLPPSCAPLVPPAPEVFRKNQVTVNYFYIVMIIFHFCFELLYTPQ